MSGMAYARGTANKGGRPSKGDRHTRTIRFPRAIDTVIVDGADAAGYESISDYVVDLVTRALEAGLAPEPVSSQEHLPLTA
jgi:hypothetical protein